MQKPSIGDFELSFVGENNESSIMKVSSAQKAVQASSKLKKQRYA
eukprot:CAMPEP_0185604942 /NCGR_PEP_ID=MMETSP0436-20130131/3675_1 /TAXON_ID=626734 ORGANISM="Favella taraikaensis, Strain Fe Narragansett Bay" /NCGR_SAMPLE_ID=MMETSP0436 /ASSEMBLY_ACC=CAM_ASM_000390 /LENGTH=44 /DNA_ID= /DNA_START= /DNA_END= /DNA_ORIENTATION=